MSMRTDRHNNPIAFTVDIAKQGGLIEGEEYTRGDSFKIGNSTLYTARLIGDPVALSIRVINKITFLTQAGGRRWTYMDMPKWMWDQLSHNCKRWVIGHMYQHEGGTELAPLFKHYEEEPQRGPSGPIPAARLDPGEPIS